MVHLLRGLITIAVRESTAQFMKGQILSIYLSILYEDERMWICNILIWAFSSESLMS